MKVLFLDFCYFRGHKKLNIDILEILSCQYDVEVIAKKDYYSDEIKRRLDKVTFREIEINEDLFNRPFFARLRIFQTMLKTFIKTRGLQFDKIIIAGFENITFFLLGFLFTTKGETYIIHHQNTDELDNSIKLFLFRKHMNKVKHIVLDNFIVNYLVNKVGVNKSEVYYIPHPLSDKNSDRTEKKSICKHPKLLVGLSNSNDENLIKELITNEVYLSILKEKNIKIVLKSKNIEFENENIRIFNKFLDRVDYENYIQNAEYFLMLFPNSFQYRMSGTLIDALSNNTKVIGTNIPCIRAFSKRYPSICKTANNISEVFPHINDNQEGQAAIQFVQFKEEHSNKNILNQFKRILGG